MSEEKIVKIRNYKNATICKVKNKRVTAYRTNQGTYVLFIKRLIENGVEPCAMTSTENKIIEESMHLKKETLDMLLIAIGELLKNEPNQ